MTAVEGIIGGGMEFPMMTLIGTFYDTTGLYTVTVHEIAHMWFPMLVGSDEKRFAWQDEGLASFLEAQGARDIFGRDVEPDAVRNYLMLARAGAEVEMMRHGDQFPPGSPAYGTASYDKPVAVLRALRGVLGDSVFHRAFRDYALRWRYKHPMPDDFFNTFEDVSGADLDWFWRQWFFETATLDQALDGVRTSGDSVEIAIERRGEARMPVRLAITREGGTAERLVVPVSVWDQGRTRHTVRVAASPMVTRVEIDPEALFPDVDRRNQRWTR
jgi:aminopeptidase N